MQTEEMTAEQAAKQARDRAFREYQEATRPKVERLPNARQNFSAAATAVTKQGLNSVADCEANFLRVQQKLEQELRQPMTIENVVRVLSDGTVEGLAPNPNAETLHQEREQQERAQLIEEILEDWSPDENARGIKRIQLERPQVTLEVLQQLVDELHERQRLRGMSPTQIRQENAARAAQQVSLEKPIHVARELAGQEYPTMPETIWHEGKEIPLDSKFLRQCSGEQLRTLIKKYGDVQVVARVRQNRAPQVFGE
jgi:hypothetical protein